MNLILTALASVEYETVKLVINDCYSDKTIVSLYESNNSVSVSLSPISGATCNRFPKGV